ncbi:MAG: hypothetical protein KC983_12605, partial [Phycisphaerales bacterium]|nr:hypothetical protein [Phycisphaerales bacterium]
MAKRRPKSSGSGDSSRSKTGPSSTPKKPAPSRPAAQDVAAPTSAPSPADAPIAPSTLRELELMHLWQIQA